jgi:hypothetical protein
MIKSRSSIGIKRQAPNDIEVAACLKKKYDKRLKKSMLSPEVMTANLQKVQNFCSTFKMKVFNNSLTSRKEGASMERTETQI